mgnify:FL=1
MKNLIRLQDLSVKEIDDILNTAQDIIDHKNNDKLDNKIVANLFFEPSTRTHYSFNTAEHKLNCKVLNFAPESSSINKGETFYDTIKVFESFGVDALVIRHKKDFWYKELLGKINIPIINAGDGKMDHPTQTLLDLLTIKQEFKTLKGLKVLICGDIYHSRVAHSNYECMTKMGMEVYFSAPKNLQDPQYQYADFDEYLPKVDVVNMLRIQNERLEEGLNIQSNYNEQFGLNSKRVSSMKNNAIIIHPAPFNRNVEINDDVIECNHSRIFKQIQNGVFVRMAVLLRSLK